jgi:hypothetical protein
LHCLLNHESRRFWLRSLGATSRLGFWDGKTSHWGIFFSLTVMLGSGSAAKGGKPLRCATIYSWSEAMDFKHTLVKHLLFYVKTRKQLQKMDQGIFLERDVIWIVFRTLKKGRWNGKFRARLNRIEVSSVVLGCLLYVSRCFSSLSEERQTWRRESACAFLHAYSRIGAKTSRPPSHAGIKINTRGWTRSHCRPFAPRRRK